MTWRFLGRDTQFPHTLAGRKLDEPRGQFGGPRHPTGPETLFDQREATELAFVAALQHLPPRQRAVLLMRDVVGLAVAEVAEQLDSSREAVSSAHQRARATLQQRLNRATPRNLSAAERQLLERYVTAWESGDLDVFIGLLAED